MNDEETMGLVQAAHAARRPDLTLLERVRLVQTLLEAAPGLATAREKRIRLLSCEALLRFCAVELAFVLASYDEGSDVLADGWTR